MNTMYYKKLRIVEKIKSLTGRKDVDYLLEDGNKVKILDLSKDNFEIECVNSNCLKKVKINYYRGLDKKPYKCQHCSSLGVALGRKHTEEAKKKQSLSKIGKYSGEKNPFYGKRHSEETKRKVSESRKGKGLGKNPKKAHGPEMMKIIQSKIKIWRSGLSEEERREIGQKISDGNKRFKDENPDKYLNNKRKAARASCLSQRKYEKNKIEKIVESKCNELGLFPEYSVILGYNQYDFGFKKERILLEVQGDYWHANPKIYNKKDYTLPQIKNTSKDKIKKEFAVDNEFKIFYIWERDVLNGNFETLEKIKNEIQASKASN